MKSSMLAILMTLSLGMFTLSAAAQSAHRSSSDLFAAPADNGPTVRMQGDSYKFFPEKIVIHKGQTIEWKNESGIVHNVVDGTRPPKDPRNMKLPAGAAPFDSGYMKPDQTYSHTFTKPGIYRYVCTMHEVDGMVGTVIVK